MAKPKQVKTAVLFHVRHDPSLSPAEVGRLLKHLVDCGLEDANNAPEDYEDPDTTQVLSLKIGKPKANRVQG